MAQKNTCVDATTVPSAYTGGGADVLSGVSKNKNLQILNSSDQELCFCWTKTTATSCTDDICLPAGASLSRDDISLADTLRAKYDTAVATTGKVCAGVW